ncbi:MAG: GNAT family N-acetyltransferase [Chloroflexota bacterium]
MKNLHTDRLTLRPLTLNDAPDLYQIYSDKRAMRFIPFAQHETLQQTENKIQSYLNTESAYHWVITLKGEDKAIGNINYLGGTRIPGLGYILHPDYWGQGITVEACRLALDYGFEEIGYDRVELWIDETNTQSTRVAQKLGFLPKGRVPLKNHHATVYHYLVVWGMLKSQWQGEVHSYQQVPFYSVEPVLHVHDIVATTDYYRDKLGFHVDFHYGDPPTHAGVSRGEWSGNIVALQLSLVPPEREIIPAGHYHIRVGMRVDDLHAQYKEAGVEILSEPEDKPWGFREFTIRDLNGHVLIFAQYV